MNLGGNTGKPRPIWTGFFMSKNKEGFMKIKKILPMLQVYWCLLPVLLLK